MTDERMNEITQYAQQRLRTGDILAAYALEVIDFAHEAVEARHQAGHSAAELMKLLSQAEKDRDEARAEVERMRDIVTVNDRRLAAVWDEARAEVDRLREAVRQVHALAAEVVAGTAVGAWFVMQEIHKITKGMVES